MDFGFSSQFTCCCESQKVSAAKIRHGVSPGTMWVNHTSVSKRGGGVSDTSYCRALRTDTDTACTCRHATAENSIVITDLTQSQSSSSINTVLMTNCKWKHFWISLFCYIFLRTTYLVCLETLRLFSCCFRRKTKLWEQSWFLWRSFRFSFELIFFLFIQFWLCVVSTQYICVVCVRVRSLFWPVMYGQEQKRRM